jgi:hypothetical protein
MAHHQFYRKSTLFESPLLKGQPGALARDSGERSSAVCCWMGLEYIPWASCIQLTMPPVHNLSGAEHFNVTIVMLHTYQGGLISGSFGGIAS